MIVSGSRESSPFGHELIVAIGLPTATVDRLFCALLLTVLGVFAGGNLLLLDSAVLLSSARIALSCVALVLIFYALSRLLGSLTWGLSLTYGFVLVLVYSRLSWLVPAFYMLAVFAALYTARFLRIERREMGDILLMAMLAAATILGREGVFSTFFDVLQRLWSGDVHQDTLFHASIAAMIKNYGVASTGLHGLVETPYHTMSHALMAGLSLLSDLGVIEVYGVAALVLFAPLLIFSIVALSAMLDRTESVPLPLTWGLACLLLSFAPFLLRRWGFYDTFFVSESYLVSLGLFTLGLTLLFKRDLSKRDLLLIVLLTIFLSHSKGSTGLIFAGLWGARLIFVRGGNWLQDLFAVVLAAFAVGWVAFDSAQANAGVMSLSPLHFIREYTFWGHYLTDLGKTWQVGQSASAWAVFMAVLAAGSFLALHFIVSWVVIAQAGHRDGLMGMLNAPLAVYSLAAVMAGVLITFAVAIPGGAAYHFSSAAFFVSLAGGALLLGRRINEWNFSVRRFLTMGVAVLCLVGINGFHSKSFLSVRVSNAENSLIEKLLIAREISPKNLVLRAAEADISANPIQYCPARPFVFPAVSERAWVDVIAGEEEGCRYQYYGYESYRISADQQKVTVSPKLLPGMIIQRP